MRGMLSRDDIVQRIEEGRLRIFPLERESLTGIGYNLSPTYFVFSLNRGALLPVRAETSDSGEEHFVDIPPTDTVLFFTREFVSVDKSLAGTFHSKVSTVSDGFGHVSTTLDPTWQGQLLVSISNPTSKYLEFNLDKRGGNLLTLLFHELETPVSGDNIHDNNRGRCDLLGRLFSKVPKDKKCKGEFLRLRAYVLNQFADSLNGYNYFLRDDAPPDKHSRRVEQLTGVRARLSEKFSMLADGDYAVSGKSVLEPLSGSDDRRVLENCALTRLCSSYGLNYYDEASRPIKLDGEKTVEECVEQAKHGIRYLIRAIDYELGTIDHLRRIDEQNQRALEFAGAETELANVMRAEARSQFWQSKKYIIRALFILLVFLGVTIVLGVEFPNISTCGLYGPLLSALISACVTICVNLCRDWGSHNNEWRKRGKRQDKAAVR